MPRQARLKRIAVVAGILRNEHDQVLVAERIGDGPFHGLWEFPGGKIDASEAAPAALSRELEEEIGITVVESRHFLRLRHDYEDRRVGIDFFLVERWDNEPEGLEGQRLKWVAIAELSAEELLPADAPVVEALRAL